MYDDGVDGDSLKEVLRKACRRVHIGTAVLPKPLLCHDVDEDDLGSSREGVAPEQSVSPTITRYARTISREFNAVVVEHHLKWAPLCVSDFKIRRFRVRFWEWLVSIYVCLGKFLF
jgi:hypothetical protein